jgi:hypothetical protein
MSDKNPEAGRRSTRLSLAIPIVISGKDAEGREFKESTRTLIINKHGAKVWTTHHSPMGAEVVVENKALGAMAKANVVWIGGKPATGGPHQMGLQFVEAQNIWGIEFPPVDWTRDGSEEKEKAPEVAPPPGLTQPLSEAATAPAPAAAGEPPPALPEHAAHEITTRILQQFEQSAETQARTFRERLEKLTQKIGLQMEVDLRGRAVPTKEAEGQTLDQQIQLLSERLNAAWDEVKRLEIQIEELRDNVQSAQEQQNVLMMPEQMEEARRRLAALVNSAVESLNRAAEAGLAEYRRLLQKELQLAGAKPRSDAEKNPRSPKS